MRFTFLPSVPSHLIFLDFIALITNDSNAVATSIKMTNAEEIAVEDFFVILPSYGIFLLKLRLNIGGNCAKLVYFHGIFSTRRLRPCTVVVYYGQSTLSCRELAFFMFDSNTVYCSSIIQIAK
jgi:hypothetical protein